ncbi:hypothetical protein [Streptomyces roseoverticillatus]|uniref:hypothetical protein n=1 Tax=Streptomyces roseoverticillatus TaxID=66429 RepID=UPI0004BFA621|nr:hypothetical protein [Streptomyces roseoverticillatus]
MRTYIGGRRAADRWKYDLPAALSFKELPVGIDHDLFRGPLGPETPEDRAARRDVAREVLAELHERAEAGDEIAARDAQYAEALTLTVPCWRTTRVACIHRQGEAA